VLQFFMKGFKKHKDLEPHHRYQLEVIFLFFASLLLLLPYYLIMEEMLVDMHIWQWYFFWPWLIFYTIYSLKIRKDIKESERINPLKRPIIHWALLGIVIVLLHLQPSTLNRLQSVDLMFVIFSIFLADSYWDFKKIQLFK